MNIAGRRAIQKMKKHGKEKLQDVEVTELSARHQLKNNKADSNG